MINSRQEWNIEYLGDLREKFLIQGNPLKLIKEQFEHGLNINRADLLFGQNKKKKRIMIVPLVITFNSVNPPVHTWIKDNMSINM